MENLVIKDNELLLMRYTELIRISACGNNAIRFQAEDFLQCGFLARQGTKRRKSFVDFRVF